MTTVAAPGTWREAVLDDLLRPIHLRSTVSYRPELGAPWGFRLAVDAAVFHIVAQGGCWLRLPGRAGPVELSAGDLVIVPRGDAHVMSDAPDGRATDFFEQVRSAGHGDRGVVHLGGSGETTRLVCGGAVLESGLTDPLLAVLPPLLHVRAEGGRVAPWLQATVTHLLDELDSERPGADAVVTRLADLLLIQAVRDHLVQNLDTAETGWLAALRDRQVGRALALLHAEPHQPWTVELLADRVASSRSGFAAKFTQLVGEAPLRYLTRLRLHTAGVRLRRGDKLSAVAAAAGYESVSGFCKAFKREVGMTPGDFRRADVAAGVDALRREQAS